MMSFLRPYPADRLEAGPFPIDPARTTAPAFACAATGDSQPDLGF
jgi:hypothetical protein